MFAVLQRMLERAQARREKLDKQLSNVGEQTSTKKRAPLLENNQPVTGITVSGVAFIPIQKVYFLQY